MTGQKIGQKVGNYSSKGVSDRTQVLHATWSDRTQIRITIRSREHCEYNLQETLTWWDVLIFVWKERLRKELKCLNGVVFILCFGHTYRARPDWDQFYVKNMYLLHAGRFPPLWSRNQWCSWCHLHGPLQHTEQTWHEHLHHSNT